MSKPCPGAPEPTAPSFEMPAHSWDCHIHVLGPYAQYPLAEQRAYTAPEAPLPAMLKLLRTLGLQRAVIAHVTTHGIDFRVTLDAIRAMGADARGTIMLLPTMTDADIARFHEQGIRGIRLSHIFGYDVTRSTLNEVARRIAPFGWHIAIWPSGLEELKLISSTAGELPVPVVLDHMAGHCWNTKLGIDQEGFELLLSVLASGHCWLKLSGMYRVSSNPYPWPDLLPFGEKLAKEASERLLWASDWPHVGITDANMPQSHELLDWLPRIGLDRRKLERVLRDNPAELYGFDK